MDPRMELCSVQFAFSLSSHINWVLVVQGWCKIAMGRN